MCTDWAYIGDFTSRRKEYVLAMTACLVVACAIAAIIAKATELCTPVLRKEVFFIFIAGFMAACISAAVIVKVTELWVPDGDVQAWQQRFSEAHSAYVYTPAQPQQGRATSRRDGMVERCSGFLCIVEDSDSECEEPFLPDLRSCSVGKYGVQGSCADGQEMCNTLVKAASMPDLRSCSVGKYGVQEGSCATGSYVSGVSVRAAYMTCSVSLPSF